MNQTSIKCPELLWISHGREISYGAHQLWYPSWWKRMSGCGPTAASNIFWYYIQRQPERCGNLFKINTADRACMLCLMNEVWHYITPGFRGVNSASILANGAVRFGKERGVSLQAQVLDVPEAKTGRPDKETVHEFLAAAFSEDLPVAFLNLSNGQVQNLDNWHWVTLISTDGDLMAEMYDQGRRQLVDVSRWLDTTTKGGAFVVLKP